MRLTAPIVFAGLALAAVPALAQDNGHRIVLRDVIRDRGQARARIRGGTTARSRPSASRAR